ncbi:MAG TPA: diaminopimelate decarboxylase [Parvularcula sp.]|nr:diaminopimelate decarboxylase [Parvularcula sp.]HBS30658.1 diaminopimelate decarboxylase [Parvularcula sp.]
MRHFAYTGGVLHAEELSLKTLAAAVETPFYCYSAATLRRHLSVFRAAFAGAEAMIAYSVKANSNLSVLTLMANEGAGADVVSGGELARALEAGIAPSRIVFSGVGKTRAEMAAALAAGIHQFNVESEPELVALDEAARAAGAVAPVAFRVNPDVAAGGNDKISTGKAEDKFGVPWTRAREIYARAATLKNVKAVGVDVHIGSQIADLQPFERAFARVAGLVADLRADGHAIGRLDLGGGLGVPYGDPAAPADLPSPEDYAAMVKRLVAPLGVELILEPGRVIAANAGVLVARVLYVKEGEAGRFLIVDAGMNDLLRPALYGAFHEILAVEPRGGPLRDYDVVGPVCETGDRFAKARALPPLSPGDLVAFMTAGAYGAVLSSQYNSRPLVPETLVDGARFAIIRRRPDYDAMVEGERGVAWR